MTTSPDDEQLAKLRDGVFGDLAGRQHHPDRARRPKLLHQFFQAVGAGRAVTLETDNRLGLVVIDHGLMSVLDQPAGNIAAHAAKTDDANLHRKLRSRQRAVKCSLEFGEAGFQIALDMNPQRAPAALDQHVKIAARLRRFHNAKARAMRRDRQILAHRPT